jgi:hypothetical protein
MGLSSSGRMLSSHGSDGGSNPPWSTIGANGLVTWRFSQSCRGEFDPLDPDDTPIW